MGKVQNSIVLCPRAQVLKIILVPLVVGLVAEVLNHAHSGGGDMTGQLSMTLQMKLGWVGRSWMGTPGPRKKSRDFMKLNTKQVVQKEKKSNMEHVGRDLPPLRNVAKPH